MLRCNTSSEKEIASRRPSIERDENACRAGNDRQRCVCKKRSQNKIEHVRGRLCFRHRDRPQKFCNTAESHRFLSVFSAMTSRASGSLSQPERAARRRQSRNDSIKRTSSRAPRERWRFDKRTTMLPYARLLFVVYNSRAFKSSQRFLRKEKRQPRERALISHPVSRAGNE